MTGFIDLPNELVISILENFNPEGRTGEALIASLISKQTSQLVEIPETISLVNLAINFNSSQLKWIAGCGLFPNHVSRQIGRLGDRQLISWYHKLQFPSMLCGAAEEGHIEILKEFMSGTNNICISENAAKKGRLEVLQWLYSKGAKLTSRVVVQAIESRNIETIEWLTEIAPLNEEVFRTAIESDNLDIVKLFPIDMNLSYMLDIISLAIQRGNLEIVKHLWPGECVGFGIKFMINAAESGNLDLVKWLINKDCQYTAATVAAAAGGGNLEVFKWLLENGCPHENSATEAAALGGHFELLKWAIDNGCVFNAWTSRAAAIGGHLEILQWLVKQGCPWTPVHCRLLSPEIRKWSEGRK